jgi:hypothetical protein
MRQHDRLKSTSFDPTTNGDVINPQDPGNFDLVIDGSYEMTIEETRDQRFF